MLKLLLATPFYFATLAVVLLSAQLPAGLLLAITCVVFAVPWLLAGLILSTNNFEAGEKASILYFATITAFLIGAAGGLSSPLLLLVIAAPVECFWVTRTGRGILTGTAIAVIMAVAQLTGPQTAIITDPVHWMMLFAYLATFVWRARSLFEGFAGRTDDATAGYKAVVEQMNAVVINFGEGNDVSSVSPQSEQLLNVEGNYLLGSGLFDRIQVADRVKFMSAMSDVRGGAKHKAVILRVRVPMPELNTSDRFAEFVGEFICTGQNGGVSLILRPNEEVVSLRQKLDSVSEKASATEMAKSRFLATVSHELRTPLNAIIGFSDILLYEMYGKFTDERQREYVNLIKQSGSHLLSVVNAVLDVSKIEAGTYAINPDTCNFKSAVSMCFSMLQNQADEKSVTLVDQVPDDIEELIADSRAVQQILINLVSNAIKFTPEGGSVSIKAGVREGYLHFNVADTGIGIARADLERLGNPFVQVENDYTRGFEGTGLGLSLVKGLVELHKGSMAIESEPGEGTVVSIRLPVGGEIEILDGVGGGDEDEISGRDDEKQNQEKARLTA